MFNPFTLLINHLDDELKEYLPPTDSRLRGDIREYENGNIDQAEVEKVNIEVRQRLVRKWITDGTQPAWQPMFFREIPHPYVNSNDQQLDTKEDRAYMFELIEGEKGYWQRRQNKDWKDMPNLWGPWDDQDQ